LQAHPAWRAKPRFVPMVGPFYQGMAVMVPLHLAQLDRNASVDSRACGAGAALCRRALRASVDAAGATRDVLAEGEFDVQACNGSNRAEIFVFGSATRSC